VSSRPDGLYSRTLSRERDREGERRREREGDTVKAY
jgi:hypothetical protein